MYYFILLAVILFLIFFRSIKDLIITRFTDKTVDQVYYSKKKLLTDTEKTFYDYFKMLEPQYVILPQINLASIVTKNNNSHYYQNELYRNIDFCIFNSNLEILLAIEINDDSHKSYKRKLRDEKVNRILKDANIEMLTYNVNYPNTESSVLERTRKALENIENKNN